MPELITPVILPGEKEICLSQPGGESIRGYFYDTGNGPVGIYLHGFRSHSNGEKALQIAQHAIAMDRSWLRFDLRGHGISDGDLKDQVISSGLSDLLRIIDWISDRSLVLHGSSMGSWISLLAAMRRTPRISGMMLIAPAFNYVQNNLSTLPEQIKQKWQSESYMSFPDAYGEEPYSLRYDIMQDAEQYDVMNTDVSIDVPLHIVHGENDPIIPIAYTDKFIHHAQLPELVFERIPNGDHRLMDHIPLIISHIDNIWQEIYK
ncbi:MAG: alpha/beta fold hydrolase [Pseudomonadota bacterium]|nr:alpha/beta fold hydrolase [Pseudomonadota bacterium]